RDQQYEEALLRAYRVLEILGEARLFARNVDPLHERLGRHAVLDRLHQLRDPLAAELRRQANAGPLKATDRHQSLLTHGYEPVSGREAGPLHDLFAALEKLLVRDGGKAAVERLR